MQDFFYSGFEKKRGRKIHKTNLHDLAADLSAYDLLDVASKIGALALMPENGSHLTRLEALIATSITNKYISGKPKVSYSELRRVLDKHLGKDSSITMLEDSTPNLFTESITFFNGSFVIFPGLFSSVSFILRNICRAIFLSREFQDREFKRAIHNDIIVLLLLSNEIARRADLGRGISPSTITWGEGVGVPEATRLRHLQEAVVFSNRQLEALFREANLSRSYIEPYLSLAGAGTISETDFDSSSIYARPILQIEDKYVVPIPELLVQAAVHRVLGLATKSDSKSQFADAYLHASWANVIFALKMLDSAPNSRNLLLGHNDEARFLEASFQFDTDKMLYVQLFTDNLNNYTLEEPFSFWDLKLPKLIVDRQDDVLKLIHQQVPTMSKVLWLVVIQGYGRPFRFEIKDYELKTPTLALSAAELETIAFSERGDRLALWKYLQHKTAVRKAREVVSTSELDEFEWYRSHKHSYGLPEDIQAIIAIKPGTGGELNRRVLSQLDLHGVAGYKPGTTVEVISSSSKDFQASVISALSHSIDRANIVLESFSVPIWFVGRKYSDTSEYADLHWLYLAIIDSLGYWTSRSKDYLRPLIDPLAGKIGCVLLEISLEKSPTWQQLPLDFEYPGAAEELREHLSVRTIYREGRIRISIKESAKRWFATSDNRLERALIYIVFRSLRNLSRKLAATSPLPTDEEINKAIDSLVPLGPAKAMIMLPVQDVRLDPRTIPDVRLVQESDETDVRLLTRKFLLSSSFSDGLIRSRKSKIDLLDSTVDYLYAELTRNVSLLDKEGLLEFFLAQNEATVHRLFTDRLSIPMKLRTSHTLNQLFSNFQESTPDANHTSVALRFLIEFISACPPNGSMRISYEIFDRVIALAVEIILLGTIRDLIYYEIANVPVTLSLGFLSIDEDAYSKAVDEFMPNYFREVVDRSVEHFEENWHKFDYRETERLGKDAGQTPFEIAFLAEFGFTFRHYQKMCAQMLAIGYDQNSPVKTMALNQLVAKISEETKIPPQDVERIADALALRKRNSYLKPPSGYLKWEVYPWKVNRNLSFIRKPLILLEEEGKKEILWGNRHLMNSIEFLWNHCYSGKLRATSQDMKEFISGVRNEDGKAFNDEVYDLFASRPGLIARRRIDRFCGVEIVDEKGHLGDIDVLVVNEVKARIIAIECKNLNNAISPIEYQRELKGLYLDDEREDSEATKLLRRSRWLERNNLLLEKELKISVQRTWKHEALIVTSQQLLTPYLQKSVVQTLSVKELIEKFLEAWIQ